MSDTLSSPEPNKFATAWWFVRRPYTYWHLAEIVRRSLSPSLRELEASGSEAVAWGDSLAQSPQDALEALLGPGRYPHPRELHPDLFAEAAARERETTMDVLGGAANLELLYHLTRGLSARRVIETGVSYGWSSLTILLALESIGGGTLISTDLPHARVGNERFVGAAVPDSLRSSWTLVRQPDRPALPRALAELKEIDLAHYDSDKSYAGQSWAFPRVWAALRPGGILMVDDIDYQTAFRDFAATVDVEPIIVKSGKLIGLIRKPAADPEIA